MDIFFTRKYKYTVYDSLENVRSEIKGIINRKWYDFSKNITGSFKDENTFVITHKWSFAIIRWMETDPAYIKGMLKEQENTTIIETTVRPNSIFVICFYLMILFFILSIFGIDIFEGSSDMPFLMFFPLFSFIMLLLIKAYTLGLRNRFERLLQLMPEA